MRRAWRIAGLAVVVLATAAFCLFPSDRRLRSYAGYAAKVYAGATFLQGRTPESVRAEEFAPERSVERILPHFLDVVIDRERRTVVATLAGRSAKVAYYDGLGGVLLAGGGPPSFDPRPAARPDSRAAFGDPALLPWPRGDRDALGSLDGADAARLAAAVDAAFSESAEGPLKRTRAVLVAWKGRLVVERYAPGFGAEVPLLGWSMTKSVLSALIGVRVAEGRLALDRPPPWPIRPTGDPRALITLRDYLRMSSGLAWREDYFADDSDPVGMLFDEPDAAEFVARRPAAKPPGEEFVYSSGTSVLLTRALRALCADDADWLGWPRRALFDRLGMRGAVFEPDAAGTFVGSSFLYAPARDWMRFALLYSGGGVFGGERILPAEWIAATAERAPAAPNGEYGLHWWLNRGPDGDAARRKHPRLPADLLSAEGYEGQIVAIAPSQDVIVVRLGVTKQRAAFETRDFVADVLAAFPDR